MSEVFTLTPEQAAELDVIRKERRVKIKANFTANTQRTVKIKKVRQALAASETPMTIPEIAQATGYATQEVLWCVMAMKKYGVVGERENDDGYYRYGLEAAGADVPEEEE